MSLRTANSPCHKTVLLLDHDTHMLKSSKQDIDLDILQKGRVQGMPALAPVTKTLWTCSVEAALEYCRVLWDIFPTGNLIRLLSSDSESKSINSWGVAEQNITQILQNLAVLGPPPKLKSPQVLPGLETALLALCQPTELQQKIRDGELADSLHNHGRIICVTALKTEREVDDLETRIAAAVAAQNRQADKSDELLAMDSVEVHIVHQTPVGDDSTVSRRDMKPLNDTASVEVHVTQSGFYLAAKLIRTAQKHFQLSSTTITGIPMKEEQNASSSANYDVELLHSSGAHDELVKSGNADGLIMSSKEGLCAETVTLKWCTPKSSPTELHHCTGGFRVTPVDVNGRPSLCLTNFLLNGRAVMLEQPRKTGVRVMSHMLASHGGEIYIHVLATSRSILEDPPSISEGVGGRVTDYRIPEFGEFLKQNRLAPAVESDDHPELPCDRAKSRIERCTRHWPMTLGESIVCSLSQQLDPLPGILVKEHLSDEDVRECERAILKLVGMEARNEQLPTLTTGTRGKGPRRDEQYRSLWTELEQLMRSYCGTSSHHQQVLDCLLRCKKPELSSQGSDDIKVKVKEEKMDSNSSWSQDSKSERGIKDEGPSAKKSKTSSLVGPYAKAGVSLLTMWQNKISALHSQRHPEFDGRLEAKGNKAELYQFLNKEKAELDADKKTMTYTQKATVQLSLLKKEKK